MKRITFSLVLMICCMFVHAQESVKVPYAPGENLRYSLYYGIMDGGEAVISLEKTKSGEYHSKATAKTVGMVRWFLDMNDVYESYFNPTTCKPSKAVRNIKENSYKYYDEVTYNHENHSVNSKKNGTVEVPVNTLDIISSLYQMRGSGLRNMKLNDTLTTTIYFADELYEFQVIYKGKDKVTTKLGTFKALKFQPVVEVGRVFKHEDDVRFWVSDDENLLPLRAEFDVLIGSIKCDLLEYSGVKYPMAIVDKK
ncbi:MAG: DUF3108 domain-containing protein [Bacteroidales bacterium]|nr:DUF3108 domain-containing protein [Bacteroidales bacterium]